MNTRILTLSFAIAITLTSVFMSAVAAMDRGGTTVDQILLVGLSVLVTILVHFLPSLAKNKLVLVLIVWIFCLLAALFNHINFFVHSAERADALRATKAEGSIQIRAISERIADVSKEYLIITSRTETDIAKSLMTATGWRVRTTLIGELAEARRRVALSNKLAELKSELSNLRESAGNDAVASEISRVAGVSSVTVSVSIGLLLALLVELSGAILWYEFLHGMTATTYIVSVSKAEEISQEEVHEPIAVDTPIMFSPKEGLSKNTKDKTSRVSEDKDVNAIIMAINDGRCRLTAASIRELLSCRTSRAAELNRMVKEVLQAPGAIH